jgi:asparagine synthase (glutamine-hydrolysing)
MLGQFQGERQRQGIHQRYRELTGEPPRRNADTLEQLTYHLRTLLHRNDTMGMAASIEARFPLLDENLVATAINLPYRHKIRLDFRSWDKEHPLVRDKWILRRVADRYLPRELSRRSKRGFPVSAYRRMKVGRGHFKRSFLADCFELGESDIDLLLDGADAALQARLVMLEAWG